MEFSPPQGPAGCEAPSSILVLVREHQLLFVLFCFLIQGFFPFCPLFFLWAFIHSPSDSFQFQRVGATSMLQVVNSSRRGTFTMSGAEVLHLLGRGHSSYLVLVATVGLLFWVRGLQQTERQFLAGYHLRAQFRLLTETAAQTFCEGGPFARPGALT